MSTTPIGSSSTPSTTSSSSAADPLQGLKMEDFLKLMITELQNQDPTNPMDNSQIMQEIGQMQSISSTTKLDSTLNSVLLGQSLTTASSMISKKITGTDDSGNPASGAVDSVQISNGVPKLIVAGQSVDMSKVTSVLP